MENYFDNTLFKIFFVNLSPLVILCADVDVMTFFLFFLLIFVINWIENILLERPAKHLPSEVHAPGTRFSIADCQVYSSVLLKDPLGLFEHQSGVEVSIVTAE